MRKKVNKILLAVIIIGAIFYIFPPYFKSASAETNFQINIKEILSVSIKTPVTWASGNISEFLRNKISVSVTSNNGHGFTAGMTTGSTDTNLTNTALKDITLPSFNQGLEPDYTVTCSNESCNEFPTNYWGYSLDDNNNQGTYDTLVDKTSAPITILSSTNNNSASGDVYFGAKSDVSQASGTYTGTIVISVVSGTNGLDLPAPSSNAETPVEPGPEGVAQYNSESNTTVYTYTTDDGTVTTQVSNGDNTTLYDGYTPPQGVIDSNSSNIYTGSLIATILAATASVAAGSGILFFILAKRKKDEDED